MALFGKTAVQWRNEKGIKGKTPNIRDFASAEELVVLINLEDTNADLIRQEVPKIERLKILREKAYRQLELYCKIPTGWPPRPGRKKPLVVPEEKTIASGFRFYVAAISAL